MSDIKDDLDAVRVIVEALDSFSNEERTRILRWASEKLGMPATREQLTTSRKQDSAGLENDRIGYPEAPTTRLDLKTFVAEKQPSSDVHFAAVVAYFYTFEASAGERRSAIGSDDLQNACRLTARPRLQNPGQTLRNASFRGFLDKAEERGQYRINTVGENLVAVTLPGAPEPSSKRRRTHVKKKSSKKRTGKKKTQKK